MNLTIIAAALIIGIGAAVPATSRPDDSMLRTIRYVTREDPKAIERAKQIIEQFRSGDFEQAAAHWDSTMAVQLPPTKAAEVWAQLTGQVGALRSVGDGSVVEQGATRVVLLPLTFDKAELVAQIAYNEQNKVTGLFFVPNN